MAEDEIVAFLVEQMKFQPVKNENSIDSLLLIRWVFFTPRIRY